MSEFYYSNTWNKLNSQFLNTKNFLNCGPYFSCSIKCKCIFLFRDKFASLPEWGRPRALSSCFWDWALPKFKISFSFIGLQIGMDHSLEFLSPDFPCDNSEIFPSIIYYALLVFLEWMNAQKNSKFEGEDMSNGIPLLQHGFFFSFTRIFLHTFWNVPYNFFLCCVRISRIINAKKSRNSRGKTRAMESHLYSMEFVFSFTRIFLWTFTAIPSHFLLCCIRISWIMNAEKKLKLKRKHSSNGNPLLHNVFGRNIVSWIVSSFSHSCVVCHEKASVPRKERTT